MSELGMKPTVVLDLSGFPRFENTQMTKIFEIEITREAFQEKYAQLRQELIRTVLDVFDAEVVRVS